MGSRARRARSALLVAIGASLLVRWRCRQPGALDALLRSQSEPEAQEGSSDVALSSISRNASSASCRAAALGQKPSLEDLSSLGRPLPAYMEKAVHGNRRQALQRWVDTLKWRCDINDEERLRRPHPNLQRILPHYPHFLHLPDREGRLTYWEQIGRIDQTGLLKEGLTRQDIVEHYIWSTLFTWDVAATDDKHEVTILVDMAGFSLSILTPTVLSIFSHVASVLRRHFPGREHAIFFINAPAWFGKCYRIAGPLVSKAQRNKIRVVHGEDASRRLLEKLIDPANLPPEYGGTGVPLGEAPIELQKRELAARGPTSS